MKINTDKTKIIIYYKTGKVYKRDKFFINDNEIEIKKRYKYLGFLLDCYGNFNETVNDLANKGKKLYIVYINYPQLSTYQ